jgi:hypothetical protein
MSNHYHIVLHLNTSEQTPLPCAGFSAPSVNTGLGKIIELQLPDMALGKGLARSQEGHKFLANG